MGCDIHLFVEEKKDGKWVPSEAKFKNQYYRPNNARYPGQEQEYLDQFTSTWGEDANMAEVYDHEIEDWVEKPWDKIYPGTRKLHTNAYSGRNYDLFAILADVRNGYGFGGCDTGSGFVPISPPKDLPDDVSPDVKVQSDSWGVDGHSHSWLTLRELLEYDWDQTTKKRGWVDARGYIQFLKYGAPFSYSGGVGGGNVKHVSNSEMAELVDKADRKNIWTCTRCGQLVTETPCPQCGGEVNMDDYEFDDSVKWVYTKVEWEVPYREQVSYFLNEIIPQLEKLGSPDDVRIVFWFDN